MKTTETIKSLLFAGVVSLTLASCGGGGGGGGGSEAPSDSNNSASDNNFQQETAYAPESLSDGMTFIMTASRDGKVTRFIIDSPTNFRNDAGQTASMTYTRKDDNTAEIDYSYNDSSWVKLSYSFVFTSATGGDYYGPGGSKLGTFTFVCNSGSVNGGSSSNDNTDYPDDNSDNSSDLVGNAPDSLNGYYISFSNTINGISKIGFSGNTVSITPANEVGTYSYERTEGNQGILSLSFSNSRYSGDNIKLSFPSSSSVMFEGKLGSSSYTLSGSFLKGDVTVDENPDDSSDSDADDNLTNDEEEDDTGNAPAVMDDGVICLRQDGTGGFDFSLDSSGSMKVTHYFSNQFWQVLTPDVSYTYTKTGNNTGVLKATHKYITRVNTETKQYYTETETFTYDIVFSSRSYREATGRVTCLETGERYEFRWVY